MIFFFFKKREPFLKANLDGEFVIVCRTEEWAVKIAGKLDYFVLIRCEHQGPREALKLF